MKNVPLDRLLIQPTVQLSWIEQHRELFFQYDEDLLAEFFELWTEYKTSQCFNIADYLNSANGRRRELHEDDHLFALLVGADYISTRHPTFTAEKQNALMCWQID